MSDGGWCRWDSQAPDNAMISAFASSLVYLGGTLQTSFAVAFKCFPHTSWVAPHDDKCISATVSHSMSIGSLDIVKPNLSNRPRFVVVSNDLPFSASFDCYTIAQMLV